MDKTFGANREIVDNKTEVPMSHYMDEYSKIDKNEACTRCNINFNDELGGFELSVLGTPILVTYPEFGIKMRESCDFASVFDSPYMKMLVIRFLTESNSAPFGGEFKSYSEMPWGEVYDRNFNGRCRLRLAFGFGFKLDKFRAACEALGGRMLETGDASYELNVFENMYIRVIMYEGDEEFPPTSQFLFSDNMAITFSAEDRVVFGDLIIDALKVITA